jgi:hypothetical protein
MWIGLGGYLPKSNDPEKLYQTGTVSNCHLGTAEYAAFQQTFQEVGDAGTAIPIKESVKPGDSITASVVEHVGLYVRHTISDYRKGKRLWSSSSVWTVLHAHFHTGECIVEAPPLASSSGIARTDPLPNFGTATFRTCQVSDSTGHLWQPTSPALPSGWTVIRLSMKPAQQVIARPLEHPLRVMWLPTTTATSSPAPIGRTTHFTIPLPSSEAVEVVANQAGWSISSVDQSQPMSARISVYSSSGKRVSEIQGGFTWSCGEEDVVTSTGGRTIVTEQVTSTPAQGFSGATTSVSLSGWNGQTGAKIWTTVVVPATTMSSLTQSCVSPTNLGFAEKAADLDGFGAASNGAWGIYETGGQDQLINLQTGEATPEPNVVGFVGNYLVRNCNPISGTSGGAVDTLVDPSTGQSFASFSGNAGENIGGEQCPAGVTSDNLQQINFDNYNEVQKAYPGIFYSDSSGTSPPSGLTPDGNGLITSDIASYSLPSLTQAWKVSAYSYLWGDGGSVALVSQDNPDGSESFAALGLANGQPVWSHSVTGAEDFQVCAITNSQAMVLSNDQLLVLDLATGAIRSTTAAGSAGCPSIYPGGIAIATTSLGLVVTQALTR